MEDNFINDIFQNKETHIDHQRQYLRMCPECSFQAKYDTQLRRHELKTGHKNEEREKRKELRKRKKPFKSCGYCQQIFQTQLERLSHYPWCDSNPSNRLEKFRSDWTRLPYHCLRHDQPHYFSNGLLLREHCKTHRKRERQILQTNDETEVDRTVRVRITDKISQKLSICFRKYRMLTKDRAQNIAMKVGVSVASVRRYFGRYKSQAG